MAKFGNPTLIHQLSPMTSQKRGWIKFVLVELVLLLLILIIARPQVGSKIATNKEREGVETIIALDISNSMLAEDVAPSRLEKSKLLVENLMNKFSEDKIGLIVFAGDAFVQLPITSDYVSAKMFLDNINPSLIGTQGTDIGKALQLSMNSFTPNSKVGKAIILITDGEDNEGGAEEMAKQAQSKGIKVFILGVGSKEGGTIPMPDGSELKKSNGEVVKTCLNEEMCKQIATAGHGVYLHVTNSSTADAVLSRELNKLQKGKINNVVYSDFDEQFQALALLVVILLIADVLLLERKRRW
jgi:von willebrand factor type A domain protein